MSTPDFAPNSIHVITGPMFSGKTSRIIETVKKIRSDRRANLSIFKPKFDSRTGYRDLIAHSGLRIENANIQAVQKLPVKISEQIILIDEIQFFTAPNYDGSIIEDIIALRQNHTIIAAGLDMDYTGRPFPVTAAFLALATHIEKRLARCHICNADAAFTYRHPDAGTERFILGGHDIYEPRCANHYFNNADRS